MESSSNSKHFRKKKDDRDSQCFSKIKDRQNLVRPLFKKRSFRTSFSGQHVKGSQTIVKTAWEHFYHFLWSLWLEMSCQISPLLKYEIWGVFVNTLTDDENYPLGDSRDLQFPIQIQLS